MRPLRYALVLTLSILAACAMATPGVTPSPTFPVTNPTLTPRSPSPTPTPPPPTPTPTSPPTPTPTPLPTATPTARPTPTPQPPTPPPSPTAVSPTLTPPPWFEDVSHPIGAVASYYNAINLHEYRRAYSYWLTPPQSYDDFVAGFRDTQAVRLVVGPPAVPPSDVAPVGVPVILVAWHTDGTEHVFFGCFYVSEIPVQGGSTRWQLERASLQATDRGDVLLLRDACAPLQSVLRLPRWDVADHPAELIFSYYNAIVNRDYRRAYGYWEFPTQSYEDFAAGFSDTTDAFVVVIPPELIEGAAGSQYAAIPTLLVATHTDGSMPSFRGCFAARRPNPAMVGEARPWRIYSGHFEALPDNTTDVHALLEAPTLCP